jgi:hypothetical protein
VKDILEKGLDTLPLDKTMPEQFDLPFEKNAAYKFARSGSYYE